MPVLAVHEPSLDYNGHLSRVLGQAAGIYDQYVYTICDRITNQAYKGGTWHMVEIKDEESGLDGFYLQLQSDAIFKVSVDTNFFEGELSADALSIAANLVALNTLSWKYPEEPHYANLFHALRYWACDHKEAQAILGVID